MVSKTPRELQGGQVSGWLRELRQFGVDVAATLPDVYEQTKRSARLGARHLKLRRAFDGAPTAEQAEVRALARGEDPSNVTTKEAIRREMNVTALAEEEASRFAWVLLTRGRTRNLAILRDVYLTAAQKMVDAFTALGGEKCTLEQAVRDGLAQEWLALEESYKVVERIHKIYWQWSADGIIANHGARNPNEHQPAGKYYDEAEIFYEDRDVAAAAGNIRAAFHVARLFTVAGPALRSLSEIDEQWKRSTADEEHAARMTEAMIGTRPRVWDAAKLDAQSRWAAGHARGVGNVFQ
ncbi:hypothetical protein PU630_07740 [Microbacterium horticulturae]|uniref:Uncharacterized protein n=1 Tax=Microbacterium horticulturae TaxID=3028316 RepID=A0ABY8C6G3_9MICO|nr:hypothetical protein [Microbacterium sp. KACC 23027]WEG10423.1 hypothetical protein PU630_07740 [Microbacterium sp. KACC 23027]